jgi:hypothetical protein
LRVLAPITKDGESFKGPVSIVDRRRGEGLSKALVSIKYVISIVNVGPKIGID